MNIHPNIVLLSVFLAAAFTLPLSAAGQSISSDPASDSAAFNCQEPLTWRVGKIDSRFGIDAEQFMNIAEEAGSVWSEAAGKPLIQYSPDGEITLNLFYSDQQRFTDNKEALSGQIKKLRQKFYSLQIQFQAESSDHQNLLQEFNRLQREYNESVDRHNNIMMRINGTGFMSSSDDDKLKNIKRRVRQLDDKLIPLRQEIDLEEKKLVALSRELNEIADDVNEMLFRYRDRYDRWKTFHQGAFFKAGNQKKINIYSFRSLDELRLVLAHEFGHAMGIEHQSASGSLMHYMAEVSEGAPLRLSGADLNALMNLCESLQLTSADLQD